jgi:SAM-dependent methyltransferase
LRFRADLPAPDDLPALYGSEYFRAEEGLRGGVGYADYLGEEELHRTNARRRLSLLERFARAGRLLDVGCAAGFFLDEARGLGWDVAGVELSIEMAASARERVGVDAVAQGPFSEQVYERASFDCVTMWDYIEHTLDPAAEVRRARELLRPGGVFALSTGDVNSLLARVSGRRWHLLTPRHHNYFFNRRALTLMLGRAGLTTMSISYLSARYSLRYLVHKLRTLGDVAPLRRLERRMSVWAVGSIAVPLNLRDIVTVVARVDER